MQTLLLERELEQSAARLGTASAKEILAWAFGRFDKVALVASFQAESSVLIDIASGLGKGFDVVTLDTGRLPQETHDIMDRVRKRYLVPIRIVAPDPDDVAEMTGRHGTNLFYQSPSLRRHCCEVRKSRPLARALSGYDAWVTGLRREQGGTRAGTPVVALDNEHGGIAKIAPLAAWTRQEVWDHIHRRELPYHSLYDQGYTSIGCAPCTRATAAGEDERAGRWWWEDGEVKECGLHWSAPSPPGSERSDFSK